METIKKLPTPRFYLFRNGKPVPEWLQKVTPTGEGEFVFTGLFFACSGIVIRSAGILWAWAPGAKRKHMMQMERCNGADIHGGAEGVVWNRTVFHFIAGVLRLKKRPVFPVLYYVKGEPLHKFRNEAELAEYKVTRDQGKST